MFLGALRGPLQAACPLCPRFCDPAETPIFSPSGFSSDTHVTCTSQLLLQPYLWSHMECSAMIEPCSPGQWDGLRRGRPPAPGEREQKTLRSRPGCGSQNATPPRGRVIICASTPNLSQEAGCPPCPQDPSGERQPPNKGPADAGFCLLDQRFFST